jgi:hypothetical protein
MYLASSCTLGLPLILPLQYVPTNVLFLGVNSHTAVTKRRSIATHTKEFCNKKKHQSCKNLRIFYFFLPNLDNRFKKNLQNIAGFIIIFLLFSLICSQIWLIPPVDDQHTIV